MPCTYDLSPEEIEEAEILEELRLTKKYRRELNKVTKLLCGVMTNYGDFILTKQSEVAGPKGFSLGNLEKWWENHKTKDAKKKK